MFAFSHMEIINSIYIHIHTYSTTWLFLAISPPTWKSNYSVLPKYSYVVLQDTVISHILVGFTTKCMDRTRMCDTWMIRSTARDCALGPHGSSTEGESGCVLNCDFVSMGNNSQWPDLVSCFWLRVDSLALCQNDNFVWRSWLCVN